jgi:hypothetical protein
MPLKATLQLDTVAEDDMQSFELLAGRYFGAADSCLPKWDAERLYALAQRVL